MATIVKFETNIPMQVKLAPKPGDWFGEPQPGEYNNKPTMQYKYKIASSDVPEGLVYATPLLHDIIRVAGIQAGEIVTITRKDRDWEIETPIGKYTKASLTQAQAPLEPAKVAGSPVAPPPPAQQMAAEAQYVPPKTLAQNQQSLGIYTPPPNLTFNEVTCLVWKSARAAERILATSGLDFSSTEVNSLGAQIAIRCEREKVRPTPEDMAKFGAEMKGEDPGTHPVGTAIGTDGFDSIVRVAFAAEIGRDELVDAMGRIYMKESKSTSYPDDMTKFPVSMVGHVEAWIDARRKVASLV